MRGLGLVLAIVAFCETSPLARLWYVIAAVFYTIVDLCVWWGEGKRPMAKQPQQPVEIARVVMHYEQTAPMYGVFLQRTDGRLVEYGRWAGIERAQWERQALENFLAGRPTKPPATFGYGS